MKFFFPLTKYEKANGLDIPMISPDSIPQGHTQGWDDKRKRYYHVRTRAHKAQRTYAHWSALTY